MDDDVQVAPTYIVGGMVDKFVRPHKNYDLCMECEATRLESHCKQPVLSKADPSAISLATKNKIWGMQLK